MTCNNGSGSPDDRFLVQQEHRQVSRLWKKAIQKLSTSLSSFQDEHDVTGGPGRGAIHEHAMPSSAPGQSCDPCQNKLPSASAQKKLGKGKAPAKLKSPLQKFDEIVTRELTNRRMSEEGVPPFDGGKKWSSLQFSGSKVSGFGRSKISVDNKVSRGALHGVELEVQDGDPSDSQNAALMDAIDKLAQAQAFCRFDEAVKAAEAATASVPPEMAEEVAVACAKDYQSEIVDVINEKIPLSEEKKPLEVIGYIGVTKLKDSL